MLILLLQISFAETHGQSTDISNNLSFNRSSLNSSTRITSCRTNIDSSSNLKEAISSQRRIETNNLEEEEIPMIASKENRVLSTLAENSRTDSVNGLK